MEEIQFDLVTAKNLVLDKLQNWFEIAVKMLPNVVVATITVIIFVMLSPVAGRLVARVADRLPYSASLGSLFSTLARVLIIVIGIFVSLSALELDKTVTSLLAGAGIVGLAMGFAFQDLIENLISGLMIGFRRPFRVGDVVASNGMMGTVLHLNLRNTIIENFEGQRVLIPNKKVFNDRLINYSAHGYRRIEIKVGVEYSADLEHVTSILKEALLSIEGRYESKGVQVICSRFGASSIDFSARFWVPYPDGDYFTAVHDGHLAVKAALDRARVKIPFPIRTLDIAANEHSVDTGIAPRTFFAVQ